MQQRYEQYNGKYDKLSISNLKFSPAKSEFLCEFLYQLYPLGLSSEGP